MVTSQHRSDGCRTNTETPSFVCEKKILKTVFVHIYLLNSRKFGQRKSWHLVGLVCTLVSFPFIFQPCLIADTQANQAIYYAVLTVVLCFGWASQQVSQ